MTLAHWLVIFGIILLLFTGWYVRHLVRRSLHEDFPQKTPEEVHDEFNRIIAERKEAAERHG